MIYLYKDIWDSYLDADLNTRYWGRLSDRYYKWDRAFRIFLAITTTSFTIVSWLSQFEIAWKILSLLSAIIAVIFQFMEWSKKMQITSGLIEKWSEIHSMYHSFLIEIPNMKAKNIKDEYKKIRDKEDRINTSGTNLPHNKEKLIQKCRRDVLKSQGIYDEKGERNGG